jgi:hypothetical protein
MQEQMGNTIDQLMILALFCKKINVPFDAYAFSDVYGEGDEPGHRHGHHQWAKNVTGDIGINKTFRLLHLVSSTLSTSKFQNSMIQLMRLRLSHTDSKSYSLNYNEVPRKLRLGGTPLNETVITAIKQVPEFQKKHGVQIVNTVFLTDGQGSSLRGTWDSETQAFTGGSKTWTSKEILVDPVTKIQYTADLRRSGNGATSALLEALKDRTSARVVGFYIAPCNTRKRFMMETSYLGVDWSQGADWWEKMKKNSFIVVEGDLGYEQFYVVSSKSLKVKENEIEIDSEMSKAKMKNTFIKQRQNKVGNKVLLGRFAEFVS